MKAESIRSQLSQMGVPEDKSAWAARVYGDQPTPVTPIAKAQKASKREAFQKAKAQHRREFHAWCRANGIPKAEPEYVFAQATHGRGWRFDWAWTDVDGPGGVALEIEGGVYSNGRHVRGKGFTDDMEKYSTAATLGWRLVRITPQTLYSDSMLAKLRVLLPEARP